MPLPVPARQLERYRLRLRRINRANLPGAHLVRRRGQSLDFREFRPYVFGDDIRQVDWRVSARHGGSRDYLVRTFEHEAQTRIVMSIDARESMRLPSASPKLQLALWLAEAIAHLAGRSGDSVTIHDLFASSTRSPVTDLGHTTARARIRQVLRRFVPARRTRPGLSLAPLQRALPPASIWLLVTDLYFEREHDIDRLAARVREAQGGSCWVVLIELDSWPHEKVLLGRGPRRIEGPGLGERDPRLEITERTVMHVEQRIEDRRRRMDAGQPGGYSRLRWQWPAESAVSIGKLFRDHFFSEPMVRRLLMKDGSA